MKKLALIAAALFASSAFATGGGGHHGGHDADYPVINDPSIQATVLVDTAVINAAVGHHSTAQQNIATNAGAIKVDGEQLQLVGAKGSLIMNAAFGGEASQNIASNVGEVDINATSIQVALMKNSAVINLAKHGGKAVQNISTNTSCVTCE